MTPGQCSRAVRAAMFAAVCVVLAATGHVLMTDAAVAWWALCSGAAATGTAAWFLAGRERGPLAVTAAAVTVQAALHTAFSLAAGPAAAAPGARGTAVLHAFHTSAHAAHAAGAHHAMAAAGSSGDGGHGGVGFLPSGMQAAHLLAAVLAGLWLAHGEQAAFRLLRALTGWLRAPLRVLLAGLPPLPRRPRLPGRPTRRPAAPRRLLLTDAITSRGPPAGAAVL